MYLTHKAKLIYPILITLFSVIARFLLLYDPRPEVSTSKKVCGGASWKLFFLGSKSSDRYYRKGAIWNQFH